ncbi:MAG: energy-coupling factor ABC transporter ATP-binding protein [Actinobacteria bacterium]|nr:energy-coupling factor ABC transporter ATP-binding protein [Actinomycetota bacterium]MCG2807981.1 energy-coupling factor ABC transporter ATP-binding protein [Coriobacteriia bacterium]
MVGVPDGAQELHLVDGRVAERDTSPPEVRAAREPSTPGDTLLEMRAVTHRYSEYSGIEDVDLVVRAGESVALLGPNGAGKTTLMKHVNGLLRPQSGTVLIGGEHIARRPVWEIARDVGMLFQNPDDQIFNRVVEQEVAWGLRARGISAMDASRAALRALGELGIEHLAAENPHEITASQRQLVAFASILVVDPKLFVLDEPTKSLDARAAEVVAAAIDRRLSRGAGVLLVTHELDFARRLADRSVVLVDGAIIWAGATEELSGDAQLLASARLVDRFGRQGGRCGRYRAPR